MAPSRREKEGTPKTPMEWKVPADVLREIIARADHATLVRCAATCKLLRRDMLAPPLDSRVIQAAPCILARLCPDDKKPLATDTKKPLALIHPDTAAASSFCHDQLSRFLSRNGETLLGGYKTVGSRRGLVALRRISIKDRPQSDRCFDMCVYDPMSGARSFFSDPPENRSDRYYNYKYVLLTAADGIDTSSFLLLAIDLDACNVSMHTVSSCGTWKSIKNGSCNLDHYFPGWRLKKRGDPAILRGGRVHSLTEGSGPRIVSYDLVTGKTGSVELPPTKCNNSNQLYLATSADGEVLKLLAIKGFMMSVWLQLPVTSADGSGWYLETVIDMEEKLWSLDHHITDGRVEFDGSGKRTGEVVILVEVHWGGSAVGSCYTDSLVVFDLETKNMHRQKQGIWLLEIDLQSRLQTMKVFC